MTERVVQASPAEFVAQTLIRDLDVRTVVVGKNFRFGHRAAGDTDTLAELDVLIGHVG